MSANTVEKIQPLLISIQHAAMLLAVSPKTIRNQCSLKKFPVPLIKIGGRSLFRLADVQSYVDNLVEGYHPPNSAFGGALFAKAEPVAVNVKRKRGRPRKTALEMAV